MTTRQFQWAITIFVGIVVIIGGAALLIWHAFWPQVQRMPFFSNNRVVPFHEHHRLDPEIPNLIFGDARLPSDATQPFVDEDGVIYIPAAFLQSHFDQFLFWDAFAEVLFVTTRDDILTFYPGRTGFYINGHSHQMEHPIRLVNDEVFLPAGLVEALYPLTARHYTAYNLVVIENMAAPQTTAALTRRTDIRYNHSANATIAVQAPAGSIVTVFDEYGDFTRVRNQDGLLGWALTSSIGEPTTVIPLETLERETLLGSFVNNTVHYPPNWPAGRPVVMAWDVTYVQAANATRMEVPIHESLNVISPMWFRLDDETMTITSLACREYVEWAQEHGVQVWPYVFDVFYNHSRAILTSREARQRVINRLLYYVDELGLDGINIGFEHVEPTVGPYLIQFLRELAPPLRQRGVVLSKNVLVPRPYTRFYRRDLMAFTVDFIIVMAYDEHWHSAPTSGPVASLPFVIDGIEASLREVPREQLVLGLPFYNRIWREVINDNTPVTRTRRYHGTGYTREWFEYNFQQTDRQWEWLPEIGKYFGAFPALEDGVMVEYLVWLECERSMDLKLQLFAGYELAGVSIWNRNFRHNEGLWEVIGRYFP